VGEFADRALPLELCSALLNPLSKVLTHQRLRVEVRQLHRRDVINGHGSALTSIWEMSAMEIVARMRCDEPSSAPLQSRPASAR
jgi:hypothetical protein